MYSAFNDMLNSLSYDYVLLLIIIITISSSIVLDYLYHLKLIFNFISQMIENLTVTHFFELR